MTSPLPHFSTGQANHLMVVSLIGHYERIAQYLLRSDGLRQYSNVASIEPLRMRARSTASIARTAWTLWRFLLNGERTMIGLPRSNSRAIRLLVALFPKATYFSYSDGLGDSIHRFFLAASPQYAGHVGFASLGDLPLIHEIPIAECIEPWGRYIVYDPDAPVLVIAKTPKETSYDARQVARLYARSVAVIGKRRPVLLSGHVAGLVLPARVEVRPLGSLMKLDAPLALSGAVGLPSTAFLTLAMRLPEATLHIMRLGCARSHSDADRRIVSMKRTLERCMDLLQKDFASNEKSPTGSRDSNE